ncbi:MAG TPA: hypothetical protein QF905_04285 [Acidimicrobiales bacterium]|jgi:hypothetical protein|nr:hypothetical protein [Actinomycetota bacterium]MDP6062572.1 hypothetical protein [Acidimicrobiales bacterium]MDP7208695.1 hypothetical protein [Acidimicrobiales bacterium]HJL89535.1 hypothetical protein [Acidimicrobiales bacterium]HJO99809.1 hypothetical protein [Acidimicrobiales bacterium]|tara:strand:+ start:6432 stop:6998 length:567 start_codon:yes stop_codon:yes gene_type:complete
MDLRTWITNDLTSLRTRLDSGVFSLLPADRMSERVDGGGVAAVYVAWHTARHHDLAVNGVLRGVDEVLDTWGDRVGVVGDTWRGLAEGEDLDLVQQLDPAAVGQYLLAVIDSTLGWVSTGDLTVLDTVPDSTAALERIGTPEDRFDWLYSMWNEKPAHFFLAWEALGHGFNHLGELITLRNRLGFSRF